MDANKLRVLNSIEYTVHKCCGLCHRAEFPINSEWGLCSLHDYTHQKHTETMRALSINKYGSCDEFEMSEEALDRLGAFERFVK